MTLVEIMGLAK